MFITPKYFSGIICFKTAFVLKTKTLYIIGNAITFRKYLAAAHEKSLFPKFFS